jgi:hypothetical protein
MDLNKFKRKIKLELENKLSGKGDTLILDKLELFLKELKGDYTLNMLLDEDNMKHELWVGMLFKLAKHPLRKSVDDKFILDWIKAKKSLQQLRDTGYKCSQERFKKLLNDNSRI